VCTQHGNEPAGREACLQRARDHAASADGATVLFLPTANPDGVVATARANARGIDINRDHLRLNTPEARAIAAVIRDYKPDLLGDLHEYSASGASRVLFQDPGQQHPNSDAAISQLSNALNSQYAAPAVRTAGFSTGNYSPQPEEGILQVMGGLKHSAALLVETPRQGTLSTTQRVKAHRTAIDAVLKMRRDRASELAQVTAAAAQRAASEGAAGNQKYYFTPTNYTTRPACGYRLTTTQQQLAQRALDLHGIKTTPAGTSTTVAMAQFTQPVIPLLLDSRANQELTAAQQIAC